MTKEKIGQELQKLTVNNQGLPEVGILEKWLLGTTQFHKNFMSLKVVEIKDPNARTIKKYTEMGLKNFKMYRFIVIIDKREKVISPINSKFKDAFATYLLSLQGVDGSRVTGSIRTYSW